MDHDDRKLLEGLVKDKARAERKGQLKEEADVCNCIGEIYARYERYEEAIEEHERALSLNEALTNRIGVALAYRKLGECYCKMGQFDRAVQLHQMFLSVARDCADVLEEQRALATIGLTYLDQRDAAATYKSRMKAGRDAERAFLESLEVCAQLKGTISEGECMDMKARLYLNLGLLYEGEDDMKQSNDYLRKALQLSSQYKSLDVLYRCQYSLGGVCLRKVDIREAEKHMDGAIDTARRLGNKQFLGDALFYKALILVQQERCHEARHHIKKARKCGLVTDEETRKLQKCYRAVMKLDHLLQDVGRLAEDDLEQRIPLYDKMGDITADVGNYRQAVTWYQKMLSASEEAGRAGGDLATIHVSIAETLKDDRQYKPAIQHYKHEIGCRSDNEHDQICRSWLNIAELQELCGTSNSDVLHSYIQAYYAARKAKHGKLQMQSLLALVEMYKKVRNDKKLQQVEAELVKTRHKYRLSDKDLDTDSQEKEEEEEEKDEEESDEEDGMSDLTMSEGDEDDGAETLKVSTSARRNKFKRNEKGETPLHRACINNKLSEVKKLIAEGHPLTVWDNSGWTPLHEAVNYGYYDITEHLLKKGADKNNRGGRGCEGITPLIDAASQGHLEIMELLMRHGADVKAKDDHNRTALDHLIEVREKAGEVDRETEIQYKNMVQLLKERNPGYIGSRHSRIHVPQPRGSALVPEDQLDPSQVSLPCHSGNDNNDMISTPHHHDGGSSQLPRIVRNRGNKTRVRSRNHVINSDDSGSDEDAGSRLPLDPGTSRSDSDDSDSGYNKRLQGTDQDQGGKEAYRRAISSVGSSAKRLSQPTQSTSKVGASHSALVAEDELVDDWLIEDVVPSSKRRRMDVAGLLTTRGSRQRHSDGSTTSPDSNISQRKKHEQRDNSVNRRCSQEGNSASGDNNKVTKKNGRNNVKQKNGQKRLQVLDNETSSSEESEEVVRNSRVMANVSNVFSDDDDADDDSGVDQGSIRASNDIDLLFFDNDVNSQASNTMPSQRHEVHVSGNVQVTGERARFGEHGRVVEPGRSRLNDPVRRTDHNDFTGASNVISGRLGTDTVISPTQRVNDMYTSPTVPSRCVNMNVSSGVVQRVASSVIKVKVQIKDKLLLIPVIDPDHTKTFAWLCEEAATRYHKMFGMKPIITLGTGDGAYFSPDDLVSLMVSDNDKLEGFVQSWDVPPMTERYKTACKSLNTVAYKNVQTLLQVAETTGKLLLGDLALRVARIRPVFKAIHCQTGLRELDLTGNRLGDLGIETLAGVTSSLPNLSVLGLACNDVTVEGIKHLIAVVTTLHNPALQKLSDLNLGYNPLYDGSLRELASLIGGLPCLSKLSLESCDLSVNFFQNDRLQLAAVLQRSPLQHLNVSHNTLGCLGLELLLKCVNPRHVLSLDLTATLTGVGASQTYRHLYNYMTQEGCCLQTLRLCRCNLGLDDVEFLTRLPAVAKHLQSLDISGNSKLTSAVVQQVIQSSTCDSSALEHLYANSCSIHAPLQSDFLDTISEKLGSAVPLQTLVFTCVKLGPVDIESVRQVWKDRWGEIASVVVDGQSVKLGVVDR